MGRSHGVVLVGHLTAKVLAGILGLVLLQCSLTIDEEALGGERVLACTDKQKECEVGGIPQCVRLTDPSYGCARSDCLPCNLPNATATCHQTTGECTKSVCHPAWDDCNGLKSDGCEVPLNYSVDNCGKCGEECTEKLNTYDVSCGSGHCYVRECLSGFMDCNLEYDDGCEVDLLTDPDNCGECGEACDGVCCQGVCCQDGVCQQAACND